jgi:hypothetical protein
MGFEATISAFERAKTVHALYRAATDRQVKSYIKEMCSAGSYETALSLLRHTEFYSTWVANRERFFVINLHVCEIRTCVTNVMGNVL